MNNRFGYGMEVKLL